MSGLVLLGLRILSIIALYAFLGSALFLLWRTLQQNTNAIASRRHVPLILVINSPDEEERRIQFNQGNVSIGRDLDCDCVLTNSTVSAQHARLAFHHSQWWVDDLLSTNGTKLNNEPLQTPTVVLNGDTINCGQVTITVIVKLDTNPGSGA